MLNPQQMLKFYVTVFMDIHFLMCSFNSCLLLCRTEHTMPGRFWCRNVYSMADKGLRSSSCIWETCRLLVFQIFGAGLVAPSRHLRSCGETCGLHQPMGTKCIGAMLDGKVNCKFKPYFYLGKKSPFLTFLIKMQIKPWNHNILFSFQVSPSRNERN